MADAEHLAIIRQGPYVFTQWRRWHGFIPDLSEVDLREMDLIGYDLNGADLRRANLAGVRFSGINPYSRDIVGLNLTLRADLRGADLSGANLSDTDLRWVDLSSANLQDAHLSRANLQYAKLSNANLARADLYLANLSRADLNNVILAQVRLGGTVLAGCDLSFCVGLDTVQHESASVIGIDTLELSLRGLGGLFAPAHRKFFAAAGVPKTLLEFLPSAFRANPIQFHKCFISYATSDDPFATQLERDLREAGVPCWKFDRSAVLGRGVWSNIDGGIQACDKLILVCSCDSLQSPAVLREIERALQKEDALKRERRTNPTIDTDVLFPVRLDDYVLHGWNHERKADVVSKTIGDFRGWDSERDKYMYEFQRLLKALDPRSWTSK